MALPNDPPPPPVLGKRPRGESEDGSTGKRLKYDLTNVSIQTPESTQSSSAESAFEDSSHSSVTSPGIGSQSWPEPIIQKPRNTPNRKQSDPPPKPAAATVDEVEFFKDPNSYLPIGSLTIPMSFGGGDTLSEKDWKDSNDIWLAFQGYLNTAEHKNAVAFAKRLADQRWIRVSASRHTASKTLATLRIYVLPDDVGRRFVERNIPYMRKILIKLINELDRSFGSWVGLGTPDSTEPKVEYSNDDSLFYLFNTLPSPPSAPPSVSCPISNDAIKFAFDSDRIGLKTQLYPYQARTVATMIKREVEPEKTLDPRFESLQGPLGQTFYYDGEAGILLRDPRAYDEARGGILGESMGLGKTLICLATILATKGNWPDIPPEHSTGLRPTRTKVGPLMQMAAAAVGRSKVPWRAFFQDLARIGEDHENCRAAMEDNVGSYIVPAPITRHNRRTSTIASGRTLRLSTATLVIVPQNLLSQWKSEISRHTDEDALNLLCLNADDKTAIPSADKLLRYDIIIMSKQRFEKEMVPSETAKACSKAKRQLRGECKCSPDDDCHCSTSDKYQSPLKDLHFLRIIMDEGHEFSSSGRKGNVYWALQLLHVDRKWIVSGTPANGLMGVEVGTATHETYDLDEASSKAINEDILEARRKESALAQERKDLEKLGMIVAGFLQVKPWANSKEDDPASWQKYIMPHEDGRRKPKSLKSLLESLVVRHRIEDIEADIHLPPLHNRVVHLQPSYHDKLSIDLFLLNLTTNALTSERVDEDYMFHPKNRRQLNTLIQNLRQSGFYWTSFSPEDVTKTVKVLREYNEQHDFLRSEGQTDDRMLMENALAVGDLALNSASWRSFAELHEMGIYVEDFPTEAKNDWSLIPAKGNDPLLMGVTQLLKAQDWADTHLYDSKISHGLAGVGASAMQKACQEAQRRAKETILEGSSRQDDQIVGASSHKKVSTSGGVPKLTQKITVSRAKAGADPRNGQQTQGQDSHSTEAAAGNPSRPRSALKSALKRPKAEESLNLIPPDSPLYKSRISGTASAKLSYLLDRVTVLHKDEKILIFYEGDNVAYYISQALDLLGIRYLIYTKTLSLARQTAYITTFNTTEMFRVMVMNVHQAAHGLHIASASRVFFVNPVWQPNVEAQAIKRAHRIGQTRPVYVETLVLKDTLEDQMLQRRKGMTAQEHQRAERSLLDDDTMSTLIKNAKFVPFHHEEVRDVSKQVAKLQIPEQLFGRIGKGGGNFNDPDADLLFPEGSRESKRRAQKRKSTELETDDMGPLPTKRRVSGNAFSTNGKQIDSQEGSCPKRKNDSEYGPDLSGPPVSSRRRIDFTVPDQAEASSSSSARRVAFAIEDNPQSLFGGDTSTAALTSYD